MSLPRELWPEQPAKPVATKHNPELEVTFTLIALTQDEITLPEATDKIIEILKRSKA